MDYKLIAQELSEEVKNKDSRIADIEKQLVDERREHAQTKLQVQAIKQDKALIEAACRAEVYRYRIPVLPEGDIKSGYYCSCGCEIDYPFEQHYCSWCGAQFDWHSRPQDDDEWALDRLCDEKVGAY